MRKIRAFTLIELLIAIVVIGILAAIGMVAYQNTQARVRDAGRKEDLKEVKGALEVYYADQKISYKIAKTPVLLNDVNTGLTTYYIKEIPAEPTDKSHPYQYITNSSGLKFALFARLENVFDGEIKNTDPTAGTTPEGYNYWVEND